MEMEVKEIEQMHSKNMVILVRIQSNLINGLNILIYLLLVKVIKNQHIIQMDLLQVQPKQNGLGMEMVVMETKWMLSKSMVILVKIQNNSTNGLSTLIFHQLTRMIKNQHIIQMDSQQVLLKKRKTKSGIGMILL